MQHPTIESFTAELRAFNEFGKTTRQESFTDPKFELPIYINEFWTSKQRAASSLHEVSYRACFKPQLPRFFISRLTAPGELVYDPFMGRGTTPLEAALMGRTPVGCDINPLSRLLLSPRLSPPTEQQVKNRLGKIPLDRNNIEIREDLLAFYHPETLRSITALRNYLFERESNHKLDPIDSWIRMVATNRLTGHSPGFFSVYTLPPNQSVSVKSQLKINEKRQQIPPQKDISSIILKKTSSLLNRITPEEWEHLKNPANQPVFLTASCDHTPLLQDDSVSLVVTSPPFLDVINYQQDNWLRCWFNGMDASEISIWQLKDVTTWTTAMQRVLRELKRILKPNGHIAFEVGEVRAGKLLMETLVVPAALKVGLEVKLLLVNDQAFTKTSNCWGVSNQKKGTNTNRIILLKKPFQQPAATQPHFNLNL